MDTHPEKSIGSVNNFFLKYFLLGVSHSLLGTLLRTGPGIAGYYRIKNDRTENYGANIGFISK